MASNGIGLALVDNVLHTCAITKDENGIKIGTTCALELASEKILNQPVAFYKEKIEEALNRLLKHQTIQDGQSAVPTVIAMESMYLLGEEFEKDLANLLQSSQIESVKNMKILPLAASIYLPIFDGIVLRADSGVSGAIGSQGHEIFAVGERGHMIGEPGSAYWIANKCMRIIYDGDDGIETTDMDYSLAKNAMYEYFEMKNPLDILKPLYSDFNKSKLTKFFYCLAKLAKDGDNFSMYLFTEAGIRLGNLFLSLLTKACNQGQDSSSFCHSKTIRLLAVGCVWDYYDLLQKGFCETLKKNRDLQNIGIGKIEIYKCKQSEACVAALLAMQKKSKLSENVLNDIFELYRSEELLK